MNFLGVYVPLSSSVNVNEHWTVHTDTVVHESHPHMRESIETLYRNVVVRVRHLSEWTRTRDSARKSVNGTLSCNKRTKTEDIDRTWKVIFLGIHAKRVTNGHVILVFNEWARCEIHMHSIHTTHSMHCIWLYVGGIPCYCTQKMSHVGHMGEVATRWQRNHDDDIAVNGQSLANKEFLHFTRIHR